MVSFIFTSGGSLDPGPNVERVTKKKYILLKKKISFILRLLVASRANKHQVKSIFQTE